MRNLGILICAAGCTTSSSSSTLHEGLRGQRYCEVLAGTLNNGVMHVDVYNTLGLGDCPDADWQALDVQKLQTEHALDLVVLNGPRYWVVDAFADSTLLDPTPLSFGNLPMRKAGSLDLMLAQLSTKPYTDPHVHRNTTWVFQAGKPVYELVDPAGRVFEMQSYSVQKAAQTEAALAPLMPPAGWKFQSRVLSSELRVEAVNDEAVVVQDEIGNTYQLAQP
jgi:hypothetical protein